MAGEAVKSRSESVARAVISGLTAVGTKTKGDVEILEDVVGYAMGDASSTDGNYSTTYALCIDDPCCVVPKAAVAISKGERAFWNGTAFTNVEGTNIATGWFVSAADAGDSTVQMYLHNELDASSY